MRYAAVLLGMVLLVGLGKAGALSADPPKTEASASKPAVAATATAVEEKKELNLPPGWKKKKRGKFILYCKNEAPMGTRLKAETCYDEENMRNYMLALQENKGDIDRIRSTCSNICTCGNPGAC